MLETRVLAQLIQRIDTKMEITTVSVFSIPLIQILMEHALLTSDTLLRQLQLSKQFVIQTISTAEQDHLHVVFALLW